MNRGYGIADAFKMKRSRLLSGLLATAVTKSSIDFLTQFLFPIGKASSSYGFVRSSGLSTREIPGYLMIELSKDLELLKRGLRANAFVLDVSKC